MSNLRTRTAKRDYRSVVVSSDEVRNHDRVVLIEKVPHGVEDRIVLELNVLRDVVGFDEVNLSTTVHYEECTLDRITRQLDAYKRRLSREHAVSEKPANRDEDGVSAVPREVERRTIDDHLRHDASPSVGADPAVEGTGLAVVEPTDGDDSTVDGTSPSGVSRAEGVGAAGASAAPTPVHPHVIDPDAVDSVTLPLAVFAQRHALTEVPGTMVTCASCDEKYWFERSKHGSKMLLEAIDDHIGHTRVAR